MGYAFISYSTIQQASADAMRELFCKHDIETWMAPGDIPAGSEYAEVLYSALSGCACLVLLLTDTAQNSKWVKKEVDIAISEGKTVIPLKLEDVELNSAMKFYLHNQQIVPVREIDDASEDIRRVIETVVALTGTTAKKPSADVSPAPEPTVPSAAPAAKTTENGRQFKDGQTLSDLADTYGKLGDHEKALELYEEVYTLRCRELGKEHPDTLTALHWLAWTHNKLVNHEKALELYEELYALRCKVLGEDHPDTLSALNELAVTYGYLGDHEKELELDEKLYVLRCRVLGEEHPNTLISLNNLAVTYGQLGNHRKALELKEKLYLLRCKVLGEEHPDTLTSLKSLAITYGNLGDNEKKAELLQKLDDIESKK